MFRKNDVKNEQLNLFAKEDNWTAIQRKIINESWYGYYHDNIFPSINEEPYRVLYSTDNASRPNNPVNVIISLLVIKSLTGVSDEEVMNSLLFDQRVQYAVHTLNLDKQPISKNIIGNFRNDIRKYEEKTGINLLENTMHEINDKILELHNVDRSIERMDSLMISSSCKKLSRIELIYVVNYNFIKLLKKYNKVPTEYECYLDEKNKNEVIYRTKDKEIEDKLTTLISTSLNLYNEFKDDKEVCDSNEFQILKRLIDEQYDKDNDKPKGNKDIKSNSLQTPVDPKATYRKKYGDNIGYTGNVVEAVNDGNPMITDWDIDCNTKSDSEFIKDYIGTKEKSNCEVKVEIVDGAYYSEEIKKLGEEKGITIHPTDLVGQKIDNKNLLDFNIDNESCKILECPNNVKPISSTYNSDKHIMCAKFDKNKCMNCPFKDKCIVDSTPKKTNTLRLTTERLNNAIIQRERKENSEYQEISNMRAGIEGIPSVLRRKYHIDHRGSKGEVRLKIEFSTAILAINIKRASKIARILVKKPLIFTKISKIKIYDSNLINLLKINLLFGN